MYIIKRWLKIRCGSSSPKPKHCFVQVDPHVKTMAYKLLWLSCDHLNAVLKIWLFFNFIATDPGHPWSYFGIHDVMQSSHHKLNKLSFFHLWSPPLSYIYIYYTVIYLWPDVCLPPHTISSVKVQANEAASPLVVSEASKGSSLLEWVRFCVS